MKNKFLLLIFCLFTTVCLSQKYYTDTGLTEFDGSKAAFDPIKAKNKSFNRTRTALFNLLRVLSFCPMKFMK